MNDELISLLQKAYDDGIVTSIILSKILKAKEDLKLSEEEFQKLDDQIRITTYLKKVEERKEQGILYVGDLTKQYKITEDEKILLREKKIAAPKQSSTAKREKQQAEIPGKQSTGSIVLIVDDNSNHVALTRTLLEKNGYICYTAESPENAYKLAAQMKPSIILCDFNFGIGKRTGLDLLHELKSKKMNIPLIIISAYFQKEFVDHAFRVGVTDYLTKPFDPEILLSTIKEHLSVKK